MDDSQGLLIAAALGVLVLVVVGNVWLYARAYMRAEQGHALVVTKQSRVEVYFTGALVMPLVHRGELVDIRIKILTITRRGKESLICRDSIRADVEARFYVGARLSVRTSTATCSSMRPSTSSSKRRPSSSTPTTSSTPRAFA